MKKASKRKRVDSQPEYDFTGGKRGKYARRYASGNNVVVLAPDVAKVFPDSQSVNETLRVLIRLGRQRGRTSSA